MRYTRHITNYVVKFVGPIFCAVKYIYSLKPWNYTVHSLSAKMQFNCIFCNGVQIKGVDTEGFLWPWISTEVQMDYKQI